MYHPKVGEKAIPKTLHGSRSTHCSTRMWLPYLSILHYTVAIANHLHITLEVLATIHTSMTMLETLHRWSGLYCVHASGRKQAETDRKVTSVYIQYSTQSIYNYVPVSPATTSTPTSSSSWEPATTAVPVIWST